LIFVSILSPTVASWNNTAVHPEDRQTSSLTRQAGRLSLHFSVRLSRCECGGGSRRSLDGCLNWAGINCVGFSPQSLDSKVVTTGRRTTVLVASSLQLRPLQLRVDRGAICRLLEFKFCQFNDEEDKGEKS